MDREKVIKEWEAVLSRDPLDAPWDLIDDTLTLLKEQEAVKRTSRKGVNGFSIIWTCGFCGHDLCPNNAKAKFCSNCGRSVKLK